jgi:hypothetical protein
MSTKVQVIFCSIFGHAWKMPEAILEKSGAKASRAQFARVPYATVQQLRGADV